MVMCEANGTTYMITSPQDFEQLVPEGVYEAMKEFFGFEAIGSDDFSTLIRELEEAKDSLESDLEAAEDENWGLECENDDLMDENEKLEKQRDELIKRLDTIKNCLEPIKDIMAAVQEAYRVASET